MQVEGRLLDVVDDQWRTETLPLDDIHVRVFMFITIRLSSSQIISFWWQFLDQNLEQEPATEFPDPPFIIPSESKAPCHFKSSKN